MSISCVNAGITANNFTEGLSDKPKITNVANPLLSYTSTTSERYTGGINKGMLTEAALGNIIKSNWY